MNQAFILLVALLFSLISVSKAFSQELRCNVIVNSDMIQGTNKSVFVTLQKSVSDFMNTRRWTDMNYATIERIECNVSIIIKKVENNFFTAEIQIQSRRPIFGTSYNTTLFNFKDNYFSFEFKEFDQLEMNENTITSNLTAVLAYYAYLIIGFDQDSFTRLGGTPYFDAAERIVNAAQTADLVGWKAFESSKNRYALINNITDEAFKRFRNFFYEYHRLGLDEMMANPTNARARISEGLPLIREANRARPSAILITSFLDAKNEELINIFSKGSENEKKNAVEILSDVNPTQTERYQNILKN
mgnify:CR=1 FL=1